MNDSLSRIANLIGYPLLFTRIFIFYCICQESVLPGKHTVLSRFSSFMLYIVHIYIIILLLFIIDI